MADPAFLNLTVSEPICFNPAASRSRLLLTFKQTEWALAGRTKTQMYDKIKAAYNNKELPLPETGAMSYMMSSQTYLDRSTGKGVRI